MNDIDHTLFVYKNKTTDEIMCSFFDEAKLVDLTQYDHIATLNLRAFIPYWWEGTGGFLITTTLRDEKA